jgi:hypothetical protein
MNPLAVKDNMEFIDEDISEELGFKIETPWDVKDADILLIHNAGEIISWPENPAAFAIILNAAEISWTLASDEPSYDGVNYGLWYDDFQLSRIALKHIETADRILTNDEDNVPRESCLTLLEEIVFSGKIEFDPSKNDFPVTLHDPCNISRNLGIVEPQRRILRYLCPQFREMSPKGPENYCCGGGSGFAIMNRNNFPDWRSSVSSRQKFKQILDAFADQPGPEVNKYLCSPCSNCKGQLRDLLDYYDVKDKSGIIYGGLVELIVNAMVEIKESFIKWEEDF